MQLKKSGLVPVVVFLAGFSNQAFSHPGHGTTEPTSPSHAAEPVHLLPVVIFSVVGALGGLYVLRRVKLARERKK